MGILKKMMCRHIECSYKTIRVGTIRVAVETICNKCGKVDVRYVKPIILYTDFIMNKKELLESIKKDKVV